MLNLESVDTAGGQVASIGIDGSLKPYRIGDRVNIEARSRITNITLADVNDWDICLSDVSVTAGNIMFGGTNFVGFHLGKRQNNSMNHFLETSSGLITDGATGLASDTNYHIFKCDLVSTSRVDAYIDDRWYVANTSNIPAAGTMLGGLVADIGGLTANSVKHLIDYILIYMNRA